MKSDAEAGLPMEGPLLRDPQSPFRGPGAFFFQLLCLFLTFTAPAFAQVKLGLLQNTVEHAERARAAGMELAMLEVSWDHFEPERGKLNEQYLEVLLGQADIYRAAGQAVILDLGVQYPPPWLLELPDARYRNQFGDLYQGRGPGKNVANSVFNAEVRACQAAYIKRVFTELGTDFYAVRLGGGWYGELTYPEDKFAGKTNCYWAFDEFAQGKRLGLPEGVPPCPVSGWRPGESSPDHESANLFLPWYLGALRNYLEWQITTARQFYPGPLAVLFPSWGIRPGQVEAAIAEDLAGKTPPEINGEIGRGVDFASQIGAIRDLNVTIHCTWLDADPTFGDEPPIHYLSQLAREHRPPLPPSAENTGGGGQTALDLCAKRAKAYRLTAFLWAFEPDLFDGQAPEVEDFGKAFR